MLASPSRRMTTMLGAQSAGGCHAAVATSISASALQREVFGIWRSDRVHAGSRAPASGCAALPGNPKLGPIRHHRVMVVVFRLQLGQGNGPKMWSTLPV